MSISISTIDKVRDIPVDEVISKYVTLKKAGAGLTGCCPFHDEKTPSFHVTPAKGIYKCFGCGVSGDGIQFVMEKEGFTFIEAIEHLAKAFSIEIEHEQGQAPDPKKKERRTEILKTIRTAAIKYQQQLSPAFLLDNGVQPGDVTGKIISYLLENRKLKPETINNWKLGFAPDNAKFLTAPVIAAGYWEYAKAAGLVLQNDDYTCDFFRNRIIIPIENRQGDIVSFGGRQLPWEEKPTAKFMNTANTEVYDKSKMLFGLHRARRAIHEKGSVNIVEGYFDVIKLHQHGWENTVATCGTSLTTEHAQLLKKYTKTIVLIRDGDKAGAKATIRDIDILSHEFADIRVITLPDGEDPDSFWDKIDTPEWQEVVKDTKDGILMQLCIYLDVWKETGNTVDYSNAIERCVKMLEHVASDIQRDAYIAQLCKLYEIKAAAFTKALKVEKKTEQIELKLEEKLPDWVSTNKLYAEGFVMNNSKEADRVGIYFKGEAKPVIRLTNYTVTPLYLIIDPNNPRRLVEVYNGIKTSVVELPNKAFTSMDVFETEIIAKGPFYSEPGFGKNHYKRLVNYLTENMPHVHEMNTLGWQPEGFFAFANKLVLPAGEEKPSQLVDYNDYGIAVVKDHAYLSPGVSKQNVDVREENSQYENDMYLKYVPSPVSFKEWAALFCEVYDEHGPFGIAFIFISAFKDIVVRTAKCPSPYFVGPKGSGKSAMAESMMWFFFSGKNSDGKLIQAYNLNPGQGTPFSFFSRLERFRNVFMLYNEYDPNGVEPWKKGAFKANYDGEGREVGSGETGKKRKTKTQKTNCVPGIAGQYLDTTDDGAVASRSVLMKFSLEHNKQRTDEQKKKWEKLSDYENAGISSLAADLYNYRPHVAKELKTVFWEIQSGLNADLRRKHIVIEPRLLNNYSLCLSMIKIMEKHLELPFTYNTFYNLCYSRIIDHGKMLKDNNVLNTFWRTLEVLFDDNFIKHEFHFRIIHESQVRLKEGSEVIKKEVGSKKILYMRMNILYDKFAKRYREVNNKTAPDEDTLTVYLKDQPYYIGSCPSLAFKDTKTSCYALDYEMLQLQGVNLEKHTHDVFEQEERGGIDFTKYLKNENKEFSTDEGKQEEIPFDNQF